MFNNVNPELDKISDYLKYSSYVLKFLTFKKSEPILNVRTEATLRYREQLHSRVQVSVN